MPQYQYVSAKYATPDNDAMIVQTADFGVVAISGVDRPDVWQEIIDSGIQIAPYQIVVRVGEVLAERARRMTLGFDYTFPNADPRGTIRINTAPLDREFWDKVTTLAQAHINGGNPTQTFDIYPALTPVTITAAEWFQIVAAWSAWEQPIILGSFWLQSQSPIPLDMKTNETYWS